MNAVARYFSLSAVAAAVLGAALMFLPVFSGVRTVAADALAFAAVQILMAGLIAGIVRLCRRTPRPAGH